MDKLLESSGINKNGQAKELRATYAESGDAREAIVRYFVHLDCSYPRMQSRAYAEAWSPEGLCWNQIAFLTSPEWTDDNYARPGGHEDEDTAINDAVDNLRSQVIPLLAL